MAILDAKTAIITGASSGIGRAAALLFAREGARLVLTARRQDALDTLVDEIVQAGGEAVAAAGDVSDEAAAKAAVDLAVERFGGLDIAFNNAGTLGTMEPLAELSAADWRQTLEINLTGAFLGARHQLAAMVARGGGALIFTSSFVGHTAGMPGMGAYAASKAGLVGLVQAIASEYGAMGIRANVLMPGGTDTPMGRSVTTTPEIQTYVEGLHALKRIATPEEIAHSALYLASDASSFTTGAVLLADGGVSIHRA